MSRNIQDLCGAPMADGCVCVLDRAHKGDHKPSEESPGEIHPSHVGMLDLRTATYRDVLLYMAENRLNHIHSSMGPSAGLEVHTALIPHSYSTRFTRMVAEFFGKLR